MGCIGMSRDDFERCTPSEFSQIAESWNEWETRQIREAWERTRTLVGFILPVYRSRKKATQLLPFPWDQERKSAAPKGSSSAERLHDILRRVSGK